MSALEHLIQLIDEKDRRVFIAQHSIDLQIKEGENRVYVLELPTSAPGSAGGRIGGIGERKVLKLHCFRLSTGNWTKVCEIEDADKLERLELPYDATGLNVILPDGTDRAVTGVIDGDLLQRYDATI